MLCDIEETYALSLEKLSETPISIEVEKYFDLLEGFCAL